MNIIEFVHQQEQFFTPVIADESVKWSKESQFAIQAFQKNDFLAKVATSNPTSAQNAIINVAAIGITLNPASKLAYLVPRDGGVCLDISYMGLLHIAQQSGSILWGQCKLVHANDTYESNGLDKAPTHKYQAFGDRGAIVGGYCTVKTPDGDYLTEEMSLADINKVAATSKAKKGPWQTFWEEMARKTIVKRASKYWPKVERLDRAIHNLNTDVGEGIEEEPKQEVIIDVESHILAITEQKGRTPEQLFVWLSQVYKREIQSFDDMSEDEKQETARKLEGKQ
ncbi:putative RecT recombination protein [Vibrio phage ValSw3-3]|nr:putative RecT recombination protein [Vibrio phage ValSw3-3]